MKELPDVIKESVEAYIGCLSGAIMKDEYLEAIQIAGFRDVRVIDEVHYPVELMANDPTAKAIIEDFKIPVNALKDIADAVVGVKVEGKK